MKTRTTADTRESASRRTPALLLAALLVPWSALAAPQEPNGPATQGARVRPADEVSAILVGPVSTDPLGVQLAALGPDSLPRLFEALESGRVSVRVGEYGNSTRALDAAREAALLEAFALLPRPQVLAFLERLVDAAPDLGQRVAGLRVLGAMGRGEDFGLMNRLGEPPEGQAIVKKPVREAFADALGRLLGRDPRGTEVRVRSEMRNLHPSFAAPIVAAIGSVPSREGLGLLADLLGKIPGTEVLVLVEIGRLAQVLPHPLEAEVLDQVRLYLSGNDPQLLVEACVAAGRLEDREAVPALIDLLDHREANVRASALQALREITGAKLDSRSGPWRDWHQTALTWWNQQAPGQFRTLREGTDAEVSRLVLEFSKKRFFRHQLTEHLAPVLQRPQADLAVLACASLGHLGSRRSIAPLIDCLEHHPDEEAKTAAWRALTRITGRELKPDPRMWRELARIEQRVLR